MTLFRQEVNKEPTKHLILNYIFATLDKYPQIAAGYIRQIYQEEYPQGLVITIAAFVTAIVYPKKPKTNQPLSKDVT